jgi:2-iminobutanoate/2-iminopropanoate deaminase
MTKEVYPIKDYNMKIYLFLIIALFNINLYSQDNMKKIITTTNAPAPVGPYNQAILIDGTLYMSGQVAIDVTTKKLVKGTIEEETEKVMQNIKAILNEVNFTFDNVVKTTIFITDMNNFSKVNKSYGKYFNESTAPARETVEVSALPIRARVEISVIAKEVNYIID